MAGDEDLTDLAAAERQAAEDRAFEQNPHGTGGDPDAEYGYDYDAGSSAATDIDYQPSDGGISDEFTSYNNTNLYADQFGNYDDESDDEDADGYGEDDDDDGDEDDEDDSWEEDWDGDEEEDGEENEEGEGGEDSPAARRQIDDIVHGRTNYQNGQIVTIGGKKYKVVKIGNSTRLEDLSPQSEDNPKKKKKKKRPIKITTSKFIELWPLIGKAQRKSKDRMKIGQLWFQAGRAIKSDIESLPMEGPATMKIMKYYYHCKDAFGLPHGGAYGDFDNVFINDMIEIINSMGQTLTITTVLVIKAIFDQTWTDSTVAIFLRNALGAAIQKTQSNRILKKLFPLVIAALNDDEEEEE